MARRVKAAEFKAKCLELMDHVRETGTEYIVTKHGTPVAKLVKYRAPVTEGIFGSMRGTVVEFVRPYDPIDATYDIDSD